MTALRTWSAPRTMVVVLGNLLHKIRDGEELSRSEFPLLPLLCLPIFFPAAGMPILRFPPYSLAGRLLGRQNTVSRSRNPWIINSFRFLDPSSYSVSSCFLSPLLHSNNSVTAQVPIPLFYSSPLFTQNIVQTHPFPTRS